MEKNQAHEDLKREHAYKIPVSVLEYQRASMAYNKIHNFKIMESTHYR